MFVAAFALTATTASAAFTRDLTVGSYGADVKELQVFLNSCPTTALAVTMGSAGSTGYESMTFGPATANAVKAFQMSKGVNATGYFGPMSRAAAAMGNCTTTTSTTTTTTTTTGTGTLVAGCTSTTGFSTTTGASCATATTTLPAGCTTASGFSSTTGASCATGTTTTTTTTTTGTLSGEGSVKDFSTASAEESDFSEGQDKVELVAFDVELEDDGSLKMDRLDLYMEQTATASSKPWDYFSKAYVMVDGTEVASMDVDSSSDWTKTVNGGTDDILATNTDQEYRVRFSGMNAMLANDETAKVRIAFDIVSSLDSDDEDAVWYFGTATDSFRFTDGTGFVFTDGEGLEDNFGADTAEEAAIKITNSNSNPKAASIEVDDSTDTTGVVVGVSKIEETEDVDVNITEMTVTFTTSDTITDVVKKVYLYDGSTKIGEESVSGLTVTFDNLDYDLSGDSKKDITVKVDFDDTNNAVRYPNGTTVSVSAMNITEMTDENDNDEGDISITTNSFVGKTHELRTEGIKVEFVSVSATETFTADDTGEEDQGQFKVTFKVTAFGDNDLYLDRSCEAGGGDVAAQGTEYNLTNAGSATATCVLTSASSDTDDVVSVFQVENDTTRTFTFTVNATATATAFQEMSIESFNWGTAAADTNANYYTFNLDDFKTDALNLAVL